MSLLRRTARNILVFFLASASIVTAGCVNVPGAPTSTTATASPTGTPIRPNWTPPAVASVQLALDLSGVVAEVKPSVVAITDNFTIINIFGQTISQQGAGSGWIIDSNGLIVTNSHVVHGASDVTVTLDDGRLFPALQVADDPVSDLAVIKIAATGLPAVQIGDSSQMKVGMLVAAIGNALGRGTAMTGGWVSRLNVSISISSSNESLDGLMEISAPINPGDSGGPLVNTAGQVIGIDDAKLVASGVEAIGYAIPMNIALPVIQQLITQGYATH